MPDTASPSAASKPSYDAASCSVEQPWPDELSTLYIGQADEVKNRIDEYFRKKGYAYERNVLQGCLAEILTRVG